MGVPLTPIVVKETLALRELAGKRLAVDGNAELYQFLALIRQRDGTPLMTTQGRVTSHLVGLFYRTTRLLADYGLQLVFVFDGSPPPLKRTEIARRRDVRERYEKELAQARAEGDLARAYSKATMTSRLTADMVVEAQQLLQLLGIPVVRAPGEGEAQASHLAGRGWRCSFPRRGARVLARSRARRVAADETGADSLAPLRYRALMASATDPESSPIVVIGGGIVGVCAAAYIQRAGFAVTLIDRSSARQAASLGNAGCINGSSIVPLAMPGVLGSVPKWLLDPKGPLVVRWRYLPRLAPWLVRFVRSGTPEKVAAQARALRALLRPALEAYEPLIRDAAAADLVHRRGHLIVYTSEQGLRSDGPAMALRERNDVAIDTLSANDLRALEPALSDRFVAARRIGETGHVADPATLLARLTADLVARGGRVLDDEALGIETNAAGAHAVRTRRDTHRARAVVVAAGAWSGAFARALGDRVLLDTERGYHVDITDADALLSMPVLWSEAKVFATPMQGRLRAAGTVELAGLDAPPDWTRATIILDQVRLMFPALRSQVPDLDPNRVSRWLGFRPSTPDSLPVIGASPRCANVFYAFGHGHVGLTAAASTGRLVADLVAGRKPAIDLTPYSIERFR